ncbi:hypothetical protein [Hoeflea poritis]|uniref:Uncharacterized protein n=1 Tax=Hoeflea poritis TaxID=2993659 RepID=A0ABT4VXK4_9HYPH|nr:hypothetical protein [Hoeflea poritis]MDA4848910.1 hypothetical protein [Hoeflea poritis]
MDAVSGRVGAILDKRMAPRFCSTRGLGKNVYYSIIIKVRKPHHHRRAECAADMSLHCAAIDTLKARSGAEMEFAMPGEEIKVDNVRCAVTIQVQHCITAAAHTDATESTCIDAVLVDRIHIFAAITSEISNTSLNFSGATIDFGNVQLADQIPIVISNIHIVTIRSASLHTSPDTAFAAIRAVTVDTAICLVAGYPIKRLNAPR